MSEDVIAIEQLLNRYCHKLDRGDVRGVMSLFAADAVLIPEYEGKDEHAGTAAIEAWYSRYSSRARESTTGLRHKISTAMIDVDGDSAESVCYLDADSVDPAGARSLAGGRYEDKLVRRDGQWLFRERRIIVEYVSTFPAPE